MCLVSSDPFREAVLKSFGKKDEILNDHAFYHLSLVIQDMEKRRCGSDANEPVIFSPSIVRIMEAYQTNNPNQYMVLQSGDPMVLFQFFMHELSKIAHCYLHTFLKCIIGRSTHFQCQECKGTAAKESYHLPFVTVVPSVENGLSINVLICRAFIKTDTIKHVGVGTYCL